MIANTGTPQYVLLNGFDKLGPSISRQPSGREFIAIYGFTNKAPYDKFCSNSQLALTPYPLVKEYLKKLTSGSDNVTRLIVIDAAGPDEACLSAVTMEAALEAQQSHVAQLPVSYRLEYDADNHDYHPVLA